MRAIVTTVATLTLLGCGGRGSQPVQVSGPAPAPISETMGCVRAELEEMAYDVTSSEAEDGMIQATRPNRQPWWLRLLGYRDVLDQVTVRLEGEQLEVTATSAPPDATGPIIGGATDAAERDAREILAECGG